MVSCLSGGDAVALGMVARVLRVFECHVLLVAWIRGSFEKNTDFMRLFNNRILPTLSSPTTLPGEFCAGHIATVKLRS